MAYNSNGQGTSMREFAYPELLERAELIFQNFYPVAEEKSEYSNEVGMGVFQTCGPLKIPEKEMTAKELINRMESLVFSGEFCPLGHSMRDILKRMKKEAGL